MNRAKYSRLRVISLCVLSILSIESDLLYAQQQNLIQRLAHKFIYSEADSSRSASLIVIPTLGYSQESGLEYGLGGTYSFYIDKGDRLNKSSNITMSASLTTKKQKNIKVESDLWTRNNDYHIITELRYRDWPFDFYGLGMDTWKANEDRIDQKMIRIKAEVEKKVFPKIYFGLGLNYEYFKYRDLEPLGVFDKTDITGKEGGQYLAVGPSLLLDYRNTNTYTTEGFYIRGKVGYAPKLWGEEDFSGGLYELDARHFLPLTSNIAVASQVLYKATSSKRTPYYVFRQLGGDMSMRGYYLGRYVDKNYVAGQVESRFRIHPRIGFTLFGATGTTFSKEHDSRWIASVGGGLRYFYSLEHKNTIRIDYAIGEKRPGEGRQKGIYLSINEAF